MADLARLFYLSVEHRPDLPPNNLLNFVGPLAKVIEAGSKYGLGASAALPEISSDQLANYYQMGIESGSEGSKEEFRALLADHIHKAICNSDTLASLDKIALNAKLHGWVVGRESGGEVTMDFDAPCELPAITKTTFSPIDTLFGGGLVQEVLTLLARPEEGKTTVALAIAHAWRRAGIGPVTFIQPELAPAAMRMKIDGMTQGEHLWRSGVDQLVFGNRSIDRALESLCSEQADPGRLVIFDSIGMYCGGGDSPSSRERYWSLYERLCQVKNCNRVVIAAGHVKRGVELADIESAAGSSAIERYSGLMAYLRKDPTPKPSGELNVKLQSLKNRWGNQGYPVNFSFNFVTGHATEIEDDLMSDEEETF